MKRTLAALPLAVALLISAGCGPKQQPVDQAPVSVPADTEQPTAATLPALALWPQPGVRLLDGELDWSPSYTYAPFEIDGQVFQGIATPEGTDYVRQKDDAVYLVGSLSERFGFVRLQAPVLLYHLPVKPGDQWKTPDGATHVVKDVEKVKTPAGEQLAARIEVREKHSDKALSQWWVPGYGLVKLEQRDKAPWTAVKEAKAAPQLPPVLGHPAPGITALLQDDGRRWFVTDLKSGRELYEVRDNYWRSWYGWQSVGEFDLLTHATFPGSWGIYHYAAFRFDAASGQFRPADFVDAAGQNVELVGQGGWASDGSFELDNFLQYPSRDYLFRWDGTVMRSDPQAEKLGWAKSGEDLIRRFFTPPPLDADDYANAFLDPVEGRRFYELQKAELGYAPAADVEPDAASPDVVRIRWYGKDAPVLGTFRITQRDGRFYIASYEWAKAEDRAAPLSEADKELLGLRLETMMLPEVEQLLGSPAKPTVSGPGGYGYNRDYRGGNVTVHYVGGGWDAVWAVTLKGEGKTPRGIGLGATREQVLKAYPEPVHDKPEYLEFWDEGRLGYFFIRFYFDEAQQVREILLSRHK